MKKHFVLLLSMMLVIFLLASCAPAGGNTESLNEQSTSTPERSIEPSSNASTEELEPQDGTTPIVYMTADISAEGLMAVYEAMN